jgi:hypothetical protein
MNDVNRMVCIMTVFVLLGTKKLVHACCGATGSQALSELGLGLGSRERRRPKKARAVGTKRERKKRGFVLFTFMNHHRVCYYMPCPIVVCFVGARVLPVGKINMSCACVCLRPCS